MYLQNVQRKFIPILLYCEKSYFSPLFSLCYPEGWKGRRAGSVKVSLFPVFQVEGVLNVIFTNDYTEVYGIFGVFRASLAVRGMCQ